ncbi:MAG: substrate-binding domain-containing protein [Erysipelotrichaceae bacterium]
MKKLLVLLTAALLVTGCSSSSNADDTTNNDGGSTSSTTINVYTRDASSGTREAFMGAIDLDDLTLTAIEVSGNGDMASKVGADESGIGYVSLTTDFAANNLTALQFNGVDASVETVNDGSYTMSRPFGYVTRASGDFESDDQEALVAAFLDYMVNSTEGMLVIEAAGGIVDLSSSTPWEELKVNHPIVDQDNSGLTISTGGSTSVEKAVAAALESFVPMAGNFSFTMNQTGSSDGYKRVLGEEKDGANAVTIGFASRPFSDSELVDEGMSTGKICMDAVVAVVNATNSLTNITTEQLNGIYAGSITTFEELN